jgi:hypothetical protein
LLPTSGGESTQRMLTEAMHSTLRRTEEGGPQVRGLSRAEELGRGEASPSRMAELHARADQDSAATYIDPVRTSQGGPAVLERAHWLGSTRGLSIHTARPTPSTQRHCFTGQGGDGWTGAPPARKVAPYKPEEAPTWGGVYRGSPDSTRGRPKLPLLAHPPLPSPPKNRKTGALHRRDTGYPLADYLLFQCMIGVYG